MLQIPESEQNFELTSSGSRVRNQAQWSRFYLAKGGILDSSKRGIWRLTENGSRIDPDTFDFRSFYKDVQKQFASEHRSRVTTTKDVEPIPERDEESDYKITLLSLLRQLPPDGFERLCQRLLRESGFEQVVVTGRSGDGGIDGVGVLQINPFVSFNVLFQCKRYSGNVTPSQIRDFRGAMQGRADKGIILTTGTFTVEAKREARRDGAPPIELVDGDDLVKLFEKIEFGLRPRTTYDIDIAFFNEFRNYVPPGDHT
jgi:restriction system protein